MIALLLFSLSLSAAPSSVAIKGQTATQAVITFSILDAAQCTVKVYTDSARTLQVDDTNETLFPGSTACTRAGSVVRGTSVTFVAGTRTSAKGSDDRMYSRALAVLTTYYYRITDTNDSANVDGVFTTTNLPLGNLYPEQPPFDANAWDKRAYPQFDWATSARNATVIDPRTGLRVKRMTAPGDLNTQKYSTSEASIGNLANPVDVSASCTSANNMVTAGVSYATCTGATTVFLPLSVIAARGGSNMANWNTVANVDDLILYVQGSATDTSGNNAKLSICLARGPGLACLGNTITATLSSTTGGTGTIKVPSATPAPIFANWAYTPLHGDVIPANGTVSVSGSTISLTNPGTSTTYVNAFNVTWPAGAKIYIAGSSSWAGTPCTNNYCSIASVQSATSLTITENCSGSCPGSAAYEGRAFGFKVVRQGTAGSVDLSFGWEADQSMVQYVQEDAIAEHCNRNTVTVSNDAAGTAYSGYTLQGRMCNFGHYLTGNGAYYLLIEKDQNGAPLGEIRPLGEPHLPYTVSWTSNGASYPNGVELQFAGWHPTDGDKFQALATYNSTSQLLVRGQFDTARYAGCNPAWQNGPGTGEYVDAYHYFTDGCFTYTNLTDPTGGTPMDVRAQITRAYAAISGTVDITGFTGIETTYGDGYYHTCLKADGAGDRRLQVCGTFNGLTGSLVQVYDSFSRYPGRWGYVHGPVAVDGTYHSSVMDMPEQSSAAGGNVLYGPWEMAVSQVNRAGFGSAPSWDNNTAIATNEAYACPTGIDSRWVTAGATGVHCIQVRVTSEPCSHTPGTATIYPGGLDEKAKYPCPVNAAWSYLQDVEEGDWVRQIDNVSPYDEMFIVAKKDKTSSSDIQLWLIRGNGVWPNDVIAPYVNMYHTHANGFALAAAPAWSVGASNWTMNSTDGTATWLADNPELILIHGARGAGSLSGNRTFVSYDLATQVWYASLFDLPKASAIMQPLVKRAAQYPTWAGSTAQLPVSYVQTYMDYGASTAPPIEKSWVANYRHINPASGAGAEFRSGMGAYTYTLQGGTTQVYKITDPYSTGGAADPKRLPFVMFAGRFLLQDISSTNTATHTITDATSYAACYALRAGECRTGSSAGDRYVSVPQAAGSTECLSNQYEENTPCFFNASPAVGKIQQVNISGAQDPSGGGYRMLANAFVGIGGQYQFSAPKLSPDGVWMFVPCWWLNGVRSDICGVQVPPTPPRDTIRRNDYIPHQIKLSGRSSDTVRVCWGYAENGAIAASTLYPTTRQERGCSDATGATPFLWEGETQQYASCDSGCTITMNLVPGRVAYYVIERKNGSTVYASSVRAVAVN